MFHDKDIIVDPVTKEILLISVNALFALNPITTTLLYNKEKLITPVTTGI